MLERRAADPSEAIEKERLSDEEMGNLISALGNHEAKALTLCAMTPGIIYSRGDLYRAVIQAQGQNIGWRMSFANLFDYCQASLSPIGLVTREALNPDLSTYGYMKTKYGERIGVPLAGLLLDFSLHHPGFSLQDFFGFTGSSSQSQEIGGMEYKKRAPIRRLKIFWQLLTSNLPIRTVDIANQTGDRKGTISGHLSELVERGIIFYEATKYGEAQVFYRLSEVLPSSEPEPYKKLKNLTSFVYQVLREDGKREWSAEVIQERYQQHLETQVKPLPNKQELKKRISNVLSHLAKNGYARRRKFVGGKIQSEVDLTKEQREVLRELVALIDRFQKQDPILLEFGRRRANEIVAHPERVSLLLAKAKEHSSYVGALSTQETADEILRIVSSYMGCTSGQIKEMLKGEERRLSKARINQVIRSLIIKRKITQTTVRGVRHFKLADKPQ